MGDEQKDRLRRAMEAAGFKVAAEAAKQRGLGQSLLNHNLNGTRPISRQAAVKYAKAFGVTAAWLLYGTGDGPGSPTHELWLLFNEVAEPKFPADLRGQVIGFAKNVVETARRQSS